MNILASLSTILAEITSPAGYSFIIILLPKYSPNLPGVNEPVATPTKKDAANFLFDNSPSISVKTDFHFLNCTRKFSPVKRRTNPITGIFSRINIFAKLKDSNFCTR